MTRTKVSQKMNKNERLRLIFIFSLLATTFFLMVLLSGCTGSDNYSGTYSSSDGLFVWIDGDNVKRFQITISSLSPGSSSGNQIDVQGEWPIENGNFKINGGTVKIEGQIAGDNEINGKWSNGQSSGSWKATRD